MKTKNNQKYLIAVSGGCDSMFLLNKYRYKNILAAFVDYNLRYDSKLEKQIVEKFCSDYKIPLFTLDVKEKNKKNFQAWARDIRYNFFKKVYDENDCDSLLTAHHMDDFLETALLQENAHKKTYFYGIKKKVTNYGMKIYRPLVDRYFKEDIITYLEHKKIKYNDDKTNFELKYQRNILRQNIINLSKNEKFILIDNFLKRNRKLAARKGQITKIFNAWKNQDFKIEFLKNFPRYNFDLILMFLCQSKYKVRLTKGKIDNLLLFIFSHNESKKIRLMQDVYLFKNENKLFIDKIINNEI